MSSWFSRPTPEEKAAVVADKTATRNSIESAKETINKALANLKNAAAKEDYASAKTIYKNGLDWLKAHPTSSPDDVKDYMTNLTSSPLLQSLFQRAMFYMYAGVATKFIKERHDYIKEKNPKLEQTFIKLSDPLLKQKDIVLNWMDQGRLTLLPDDYKNKGDDLKELFTGLDGKEDLYNLKAIMDEKELEKVQITENLEDNTINIPRLIGKIASITGIILGVVLLLWGGFLGACYSTNLNIYRSFNFRVFYAIYGALFWAFVVPYELIYKKWWLSEPLKMHGYIPLFDGPAESWSWFAKNLLFFFEKKPVVDMEG